MVDRAVRHLAAGGFAQFLEVGCPLPTAATVHGAAHAVNPGSRTVYAADEAMVAAHARAHLADRDRVQVVASTPDLVAACSSAPETTALLDLREPVAVVVTDAGRWSASHDIAKLIAAVMAPLAMGSAILLTHARRPVPHELGSNRLDLRRLAALEELLSHHLGHGPFRTDAQTEQLLEGLSLPPPGIVPVSAWRVDRAAVPDAPPMTDWFTGGIAFKPTRARAAHGAPSRSDTTRNPGHPGCRELHTVVAPLAGARVSCRRRCVAGGAVRRGTRDAGRPS